MGIYDSSRTRVAPVFGRLQCWDPSGRMWLRRLLELANSRQVPVPEVGTSRLRVAKWWPREARLAAPPGLLQWLSRACGGATECQSVGSETGGRGQSAPNRRPRCRHSGCRIEESSITPLVSSRLVCARRAQSTRRLSSVRRCSRRCRRQADGSGSDNFDRLDDGAASNAAAPRCGLGASAGSANLRPVHCGGGGTRHFR